MATMWIGLVIVAVTLGLVSAGVMLDNRQLREESRRLRAELDTLGGESAVWQSERQLLEEELGAQRERVTSLSTQLAEMKVETETKSTVVAQTAYRVRAYLENQAVGQGWLLPGRSTTNANGGLVYEPVVVLDPSTRAALTGGNGARKPEAEMPAVVTVNNNYPYPRTYDYTWPGYWVWSTGHKGHRPGHKPDDSVQPQPPASPPVSPFLSTRIWQPQTGFQQMPRGRPGGDWISSAPRGHSYISSGATRSLGTGGSPFPARY
jgi:hypothetical protein